MRRGSTTSTVFDRLALRGVRPECRFDGIDAIVTIRTRGATQREKADKKRVCKAAREIAR